MNFIIYKNSKKCITFIDFWKKYRFFKYKFLQKNNAFPNQRKNRMLSNLLKILKFVEIIIFSIFRNFISKKKNTGFAKETEKSKFLQNY